MKRPMLVFGTTAIAICSALILFKGAAVVVPIISASVLFLYIFKRKLFKGNIIIPTVCVAALICTFSFLLINQIKIAPVVEFNNTKQDIHGKIISLPQSTEDSSEFILQADKIGDTKVKFKIEITLSGKHSHQLYDYISVSNAQIYIPTNSNGDYDYSQIADSTLLCATSSNADFLWKSDLTPYYHILNFKSIVCQKADDYLSKDLSGLFKGMLFGDKSDLSPTTEKSFRAAGISHLLAVSGLHTSLWCGLILSLFMLLKIPQKAGNVLCIVFLLIFCIVACFTPSVIRATVMAIAVLISPFFKRTPDSLNSLGAAVAFILIINPFTITSISFQLSAAATLGVLAANHFSTKLLSFIREKYPPKLIRILNFISSSLIISCCAGIFTLPISAYHFGVVSLVAPLSNILCIQLAFYGLIAGAISVALSFINLSVFAPIIVISFRCTSLLLSIVTILTNKISSLKLCSVAINKDTLIIYIVIISILLSLAYLMHRKSKSKSIVKATAIVCAVVTLLTVATPFIPFTQANSITVFRTSNGIHVLIKSGNHYAFIENGNSRLSTNAKLSLPQATSESLDYHIVSYTGKQAIDNLSYIHSVHSSQNIMLSSSAYKSAVDLGATIPQSAQELSNFTFNLNNEITVEIVDTGSIKYVIIKGSIKNVYIHLHGNASHTDLIKQNDCEIAVFNGVPQKPLSVFVPTVIISTGTNIDSGKLSEIESTCKELYTTAQHNDITIEL